MNGSRSGANEPPISREGAEAASGRADVADGHDR
jgi:hypothetical protein